MKNDNVIDRLKYYEWILNERRINTLLIYLCYKRRRGLIDTEKLYEYVKKKEVM